MLKFFAVLFFVPSMLLFFVSEKPKHISNSFPTPSPTKTPSNENQEGIENLTLDKDDVFMWCPVTLNESGSCPKSKVNVKINTHSQYAEKNNLKYYYVVSGGEITGQGANVTWDFSKARPGKYTITAGVGSDYIFYGKTMMNVIYLANVRHLKFQVRRKLLKQEILLLLQQMFQAVLKIRLNITGKYRAERLSAKKTVLKSS